MGLSERDPIERTEEGKPFLLPNRRRPLQKGAGLTLIRELHHGKKGGGRDVGRKRRRIERRSSLGGVSGEGFSAS